MVYLLGKLTLDEMLRTTTIDEIRRRYEKEAPRTIEYSTVIVDSSPIGDYDWLSDGGSLAQGRTDDDLQPIHSPEFIASLRTTAAQNSSLTIMESVRSLDPNEPFTSALNAIAIPVNPLPEQEK